MSEPRYISIKRCARCGNDHERVKFYKFTSPIEDNDGTIWQWYGECPHLKEPILMRDSPSIEVKVTVNEPTTD